MIDNTSLSASACFSDRRILRERLKERQCLQDVMTISSDSQQSLNLIMQRLVPVIQSGWQFPEITHVQIDFEGRQHQTVGFQTSAQILFLERLTEAGDPLRLTIAYAGLASGQPAYFIPDEAVLAESIADRLAEVVNRRRTLRSIQEKDDLVCIMFSRTSESIALVDPSTGRYAEFNSVACRDLGYAREEFACLTVMDIQVDVPPADVFAAMASASEGRTLHFENRHRHRSGEIRDVSVVLTPIGHHGKPFICAVWRDITEQKRQMREQQALTERLQARTRLISRISAMESGLQGDVAAFTGTICELASDWLEVDRVSYWEFSEDGNRMECVDLFDRASRRHDQIQPIDNDNMGIQLLYERLRDASCIEIFADSSDPVERCFHEIHTQPTGPVRLLAHAVMFHGRQVGMIVLGNSQPGEPWKPDDIVFCGNLSAQIGICYLNRDRLATVQELRQHRDQLEQMVVSRTAELKMAKEAAETASRAKSRFLSNMSHEIRTPMNAVVNFSHMIGRDAMTTRQMENFGKLIGATDHLMSVINDILDLSKIEAGKMRLDVKVFDPAEVIENACSMIASTVRDKRLWLAKRLDGVPPRLRGDGARLGQILLNMLSNAAKFTETGGISVRCCVAETHPGLAILRITVQDTGIGMTEEQQARLFIDFEQAHDATARLYGGTGLGMAICQNLVTMMDGRIGVESVYGQGTTMWIEIPFRIADGATESCEADCHDRVGGPQPTWPCRPVRILVAEDNAINQDVICQLLDQPDVTLALADNGEIAAERVRSERFDLILMDAQMPVMDGYEATRAIRALPGGTHIPIIAMTASAFDEDRQRCLDAGMDDHLAKPVVPGQLYRMLSRWLPEPELARPADDATVSTGGSLGQIDRQAMSGAGRVMAADGHVMPADGASIPTKGSSLPIEPAPYLPIGFMDELAGVPGLDMVVGLQYVQHDLPFYRHILARFIDRHAQDDETIHDALACGDFMTLRKLSHVLKGVAGTLGMVQIQWLATETEKLAGQMHDGRPSYQAAVIRLELETVTTELAYHLRNLVEALRGVLDADRGV